ncbi:hypothetical protein ACLX1H_010987 [Fusarium chlamydosporum]
MHFLSAVAIVAALPVSIAAAISKPEHESGAVFKRGATCYNTNSNNGGYATIPEEDIQGLVDQLNSIGSDEYPLYYKLSPKSDRFTYTWNQAKICVTNEYWTPENTHLKMSEAAWVVGYIRDQCSSE